MKKTISILLFTLITIACTAQSQEYSFSEKYTIKVPAKLTVSSYNGAIDIISSDVNEIELRYIATKNNIILSINKDDIQNEGISIKVEHDKNSLDINVTYPVGYFKLDFSKRIYVNFEIHVPKETECNLITHDGNISIQGLKSNQECTTKDGNIEILGVNGNISIKASDSNIKILEVTGDTSIKASDGKINLSKINGSISVNVSDAIVHADEIKGSVYIKASDNSMFLNNINGKVHCIASDGNIELKNVNGEIIAKTAGGHILFTNLSGSLDACSMDGDVKGNIQELKNPITIEAGSGNIDISLTNNIGFNLNIKGIRNNTPVKNFQGSSNKYFMKGKVNGGGIEVNLLSIDGKINIVFE